MLIVVCFSVTKNMRKERKVERTPPPKEKSEQYHPMKWWLDAYNWISVGVTKVYHSKTRRTTPPAKREREGLRPRESGQTTTERRA